MFCIQCGNKMDEDDGFCNMCGASRTDTASDPTFVAQVQPAHSRATDPSFDSPTPSAGFSGQIEATAPGAPKSTGSQNPHGHAPRPAANNVAVGGAVAKSKAPGIIAIAIIGIAAVAVGGALVIGGLSGPGTSDAGDAPSSSTSAPVFSSSPDDSVEDREPAPSSGSQSVEEEPAVDRIQANGFSFELPDYWKGKVICQDTEDGVAIYPDTALGMVQGYELATLSLVSTDTPENGGDYISHIAGRVYGEGNRVDVLSKNWAAFYGGDWYRHPNYAGSSQEQEMVSALIDLSSGGRFNYNDVRSVAGSASNDADAYTPFLSVDVEFLNDALIPTIEIDEAGNDAKSQALSDEEYAFIAEQMALSMFTTAENTGDGSMKWIGCDNALLLVEPGSDAAACDYWEDTTFHVYLRVARDATITKTFDPRHFQVEVTYEAAIDATGANRQANIAVVELWLADSGTVEDIEVVSLS